MLLVFTINMMPIFYKIGIVFIFVGLAIKIPAIFLDTQSIFHFGFVFSIIGFGFVVAAFTTDIIRIRKESKS